MSVYTLELEGGRFYVGYTDDVPRRIAEHFMGRGAHWKHERIRR
jgi:predicted GIY-YIG superfamily endonuclease